MKRKNREPALKDFLAMLKLRSFEQFLHKLVPTLDAEQQNFLLKELPGTLRKLKKERNRRAHERLQTYQREDVAPLLKKFLGIGQTGVLPFLARMPKTAR